MGDVIILRVVMESIRWPSMLYRRRRSSEKWAGSGREKINLGEVN